jgi:hypothetical protein
MHINSNIQHINTQTHMHTHIHAHTYIHTYIHTYLSHCTHLASATDSGARHARQESLKGKG